MNNEMKKIMVLINRDKKIYIASLFIIAITLIISWANGVSNNLDTFIYLKSFYKATVISASVYFILYVFYLMYQRESRPILAYWNRIKSLFINYHEVINFVFLSLFLSIVFSCYTSLKTMIPAINAYYLDSYLIKIDEFIHFGYAPWELTHKIFNSPIATGWINLLYNIWFFIFWVYLITFLVRVNQPRIREKVLLSFCLCWIINGGFLAILFSSVGPAFYELAYPSEPDYFSSLMSLLTEQNNWLLDHDIWVNVWALDLQEMLWINYLAIETTLGSGISAMPSMHVSIATLMAISIYSVNKKLGTLFWIYLVFIQIGSVHLAWHYAVDGYLSIILTIIIWKMVCFITSERMCLKRVTQGK